MGARKVIEIQLESRADEILTLHEVGRSRQYDASIGRWLSKDPIGFAGGQANLYAYSINDPIDFFDSTGLAFFSFLSPTQQANAGAITGAIAAGLIGFGIFSKNAPFTLIGAGAGYIGGSNINEARDRGGSITFPLLDGIDSLFNNFGKTNNGINGNGAGQNSHPMCAGI